MVADAYSFEDPFTTHRKKSVQCFWVRNRPPFGNTDRRGLSNPYCMERLFPLFPRKRRKSDRISACKSVCLGRNVQVSLQGRGKAWAKKKSSPVKQFPQKKTLKIHTRAYLQKKPLLLRRTQAILRSLPTK